MTKLFKGILMCSVILLVVVVVVVVVVFAFSKEDPVEEYLAGVVMLADQADADYVAEKEEYLELLNELSENVPSFAKAKALQIYYRSAEEVATEKNTIPTHSEIMDKYYEAGGDSKIYDDIQNDVLGRVFTEEIGYNGPDSLFYTCLKSDGCYVTQSDAEHFKANGYLAVDIGTNDKNIAVHAPDYHNHEVEYTVEYAYYPDTTGETVELYGEYEGAKFMWRIGHIHPEGYEDLQIVQTGDRIATSGGETELDNQGVTTGKHVHIEFLLWDGEKYAPTPYRLNDSINKHIEDPTTAEKEYITETYFSGYNAGDISQNDGAPCISASGKDICEMINEGKQVVAITSDVREKYDISFGDVVYLEGDVCEGYYYVEDEMNKRYREGCETSENSQGYCIKGDIAFPYGEPVQGCLADIYKLS